MDQYQIAPGDTLSGISAAKGIPMNDILAANPHITNPDLIYAGSTLNLPRAAAPNAGPAVTVPPGTGAPTPNPAPVPTAAPASNTPAAAPDPDQLARESAAKDLGYPTFDSFLQDVTTKPSKSTEQMYNDAYAAAGLPDILSKISSKKDALNSALGTVNDNPWYDEAFRRGEAARLQNLAGTDIKNLQSEYSLRLANVHDLVAREAADMAANDKVNAAKLNYLHQAVQESQASQKTAASAAKADATPPKTISSPTTSNVYQYNPTTKQFDLVQKGVPRTSSKGGGGSSSAQKLLDKFNSDLAKINPKTDTRESLLTRLVAKYGSQIDPNDISRKVYETYPNGWESRFKTGKTTSSSATPNSTTASANYLDTPTPTPIPKINGSIRYVAPKLNPYNLDKGGVRQAPNMLEVYPHGKPVPRLI
jgi:LysM repeat protein